MTTLPAVLALVAVHLYAHHLRLPSVPRSRTLSLAGGISVAYVFVQLLPELTAHQEHLAGEVLAVGRLAERQAYLFALAGLTSFYVIENVAKHARASARPPGPGATEQRAPGVYGLHLGSFALYNLVLGYLLLDQAERSRAALLLYTVAMALHLVVNDHGLQDHYLRSYARHGRWLLALALLGGWSLGLTVRLPPAAVAVALAVVSGGVVLNVLKEELPEERESSVGAFLLGVVGYTILLLGL